MFEITGMISTFLSGTSIVTQALKGVFFGAVIFLPIFVIMWWMSFRHIVTLRVITRNGKYIRRMFARSKKIKGTNYWQVRVLFRRVLYPAPPPQAIDITKKGRFYAEANVTEENPQEPVWLIDTNKEYGAFEPFTTQERALYAQMMEEAESHRHKSIGDILLSIAPYMVMFLMFVMLLVFFEDIVKPSQQVLGQVKDVNTQFAKITESQAKITGDLARIMDVTGVEVVQRVPPETKAEERLDG